MATSSQVKSGLDEIAGAIAAQRASMEAAKAAAAKVSLILGALPTAHADLVTTIQGYGTTNAFEALSKAEMAKLAAEYTALKAAADAVAAIEL